MKKITTIATALLLGLGVTASAAESLTATSVPANGSKITWGAITLTWSQPVMPTEENPMATVSYAGNEGTEVPITVYYSSEETAGGVKEGPATDINVDWSTYFTEKGEYEVIIPAGLFEAAADPSVTNEEISLSYTLVGYDGQYTVSPTPYYINYATYSASELSEVTVAWGTPFMSVDTTKEITYSGDSNGVVSPDLVSVNKEKGEIVLDLSGFSSGIWFFEIPMGYAAFSEYMVSSSVELTYSIFDGMSSATVLSPTTSIVALPGYVDLTWGYQTVTANPAKNVTVAYYDREGNPASKVVPQEYINLISTGGNEPGEVNPQAEAGEKSGNVLSINVSQLLSDALGYVTVKVPEGFVENADGLVNPAQAVEFQIMPVYEGAVSAEYDALDGVLNFTWGDKLEVYFNQNAGNAILQGPAGEEIVLTQYEEIDVVNYNTIAINLGDMNLAGDYTLVIPEGYIGVDFRYCNKEVVYGFNITNGVLTPDSETSGIGSVKVSDEEEAIYNLQGVRVNRGAMKSGVYIINGKKVLFRD